MRKSFILHLDSLSILTELSSDEAGELFKAIYYYQIGEVYDLPTNLRLLFIQFKNQFERDNVKYHEVVNKRSEAGKAGANKRWQMLSDDNKSKQKKAKIADSVNDNDSVNDSNNKNNTIPPLLNDVLAYCMQRNNGVDINKWFNFYESKGWLVGKTKMKDWQASIRTWEISKDEQNKKSRYIPPIVHE